MSDELAALAVVLIAPLGCAGLERTLTSLAAQTALSSLELVIVAPADTSGDAPFRAARGQQLLAPFPRVRLVPLVPGALMAEARLAGTRAATSPLVVFGEDHSFPDPGWAEALIDAHRGPWSAVAPQIVNGNPGTLLSWADLYLGFGPWVAPQPGGEVEGLPWHNCSYKRTDLLSLAGEDVELFEAEGLFHEAMRRRGLRLYLESRATTRHVNVSRLGSFVRIQYHGARSFAAARRDGWPARRIALQLAAAPLLPLVRLRKHVGQVSASHPELLPRVLPLLALGSLVAAWGELAGYMLGAGVSRQGKSDLEIQRERHVVAGDRPVIGGLAQ